MSYTIYIHTNKINGKVYVGQTSQSVEQRWRNGNGYINNTYFNRAIEKYGWDNFKHEILCTGLSEEEADRMEIVMIARFCSNDPDKGYNLTIGGEGTHGYHHTEETKNKISELQTGRRLTEEWKKHISESLKGNNAYWYGKTFSEEHKKHLSESHLGQESARGMLGKKHSEETKRKMSESRMGHETSQETRDKIGSANSKKVRCIETGIVYSGLPEAFKETGCQKSGISMCCNGKQNACKGYHWEYVS